MNFEKARAGHIVDVNIFWMCSLFYEWNSFHDMVTSDLSVVKDLPDNFLNPSCP